MENHTNQSTPVDNHTDQALSSTSLTHRVSMMRHVTSWADLPVEIKLTILGHCLRFPDPIIENDHRFHLEDDLLPVILTSNEMYVLGCEQYYANTFVGRCSSKLEPYEVCLWSLPHCSIGGVIRRLIIDDIVVCLQRFKPADDNSETCEYYIDEEGWKPRPGTGWDTILRPKEHINVSTWSPQINWPDSLENLQYLQVKLICIDNFTFSKHRHGDRRSREIMHRNLEGMVSNMYAKEIEIEIFDMDIQSWTPQGYICSFCDECDGCDCAENFQQTLQAVFKRTYEMHKGESGSK